MASKKILLLIGGEDPDQHTIRRAMELDGYTVVHLKGAAACLKAAAACPANAIVLDSLAICQQLRRSIEHAETPIVWLTGNGEGNRSDDALAAGADELLRTPVTAVEARTRIRSVVGDRELRKRVRDVQHFRRDFMDQLVHDLRSPLQVILGFSELLMESLDVPRAEHDQARSIWTAASRIEKLADNLIVSTRLETGDLIPESQFIAPPEVAGQIMAIMRPIAELRRITLTLEASPECAGVRADANLVGRALQILIDNAVRFSPSGSTVRVRISSGGPARLVTLEVFDRGPEIAEAEREQLFDLHRLLALRKAGHTNHGRGLGLSLCRLVAEAHGGRVRVESNPAGGSVFVLELPQPAD